METVAGQPSSIVKLGVVLKDLGGVRVENKVVDTTDLSSGEWSQDPSPGDGVAAIPDLDSLSLNFRLEDTLAIVKGGLAWESHGAKLIHC